MTKSQNRTPVRPYPTHGPCTAAMVGLKSSMPDSKLLIVGFSQKVPANVPTDPAPSFRSPPAQYTSPLAVRIPTQASSSPRNRSHAALRSSRNAPLMALRAPGRFSVIVAMWLSTS